MAWFRFLKDATRWAICYPAMAYIAAVDDVFHRPSMLTDACEILEKMDVVVAVGVHATPHMRVEIAHARMRKIPVMELFDLGEHPPWIRRDEVSSDILRRAAALGL